MSVSVKKPSTDTRFALSLALVTLLAPVATDLSLASMPDIARHLDASYASVQLTLTVYLLAQGVEQVLFGPVIDRFARRAPLLDGIAVFTLSAVWGGFSGSITTLLVSRFVRGLAEPTLVSLTMGSQDRAMGFTAALMGCMHLVLSSLATPISGILLPLGAPYWFAFLPAAGGVTLGVTLAAKADVRLLARAKQLSGPAAV